LSTFSYLSPLTAQGFDGLPVATVAPGAISGCEKLVRIAWRGCDGEIAAGYVYVQVDLPAPSAVMITAESSKLAAPSDLASAAPFYVATTTTLYVDVRYADGRVDRIPAGSSSVSWSIVNGSNLVSLDNHTATLAALPGAPLGAGPVVVRARYAGVLAEELAMPIVSAQEVRMAMFPVPARMDGGSVSTLRTIGCSGAWQTGTLSMTGVLSDGSSRELTLAEGAFFSSAPGVASVNGSRLSPRTVGATNVRGCWGSGPRTLCGASNRVQIDSASTSVTSLTLHADFLVSSTFSAMKDRSRPTRVHLRFDDETEMLSGGDQGPWSGVMQSLVGYSSDEPLAIDSVGSPLGSCVNNCTGALLTG